MALTIVYIAIGLALTTIAIEIAADTLKKLHYYGRKIENVGNVAIWFGGKKSVPNSWTYEDSEFFYKRKILKNSFKNRQNLEKRLHTAYLKLLRKCLENYCSNSLHLNLLKWCKF